MPLPLAKQAEAKKKEKKKKKRLRKRVSIPNHYPSLPRGVVEKAESPLLH